MSTRADQQLTPTAKKAFEVIDAKWGYGYKPTLSAGLIALESLDKDAQLVAFQKANKKIEISDLIEVLGVAYDAESSISDKQREVIGVCLQMLRVAYEASQSKPLTPEQVAEAEARLKTDLLFQKELSGKKASRGGHKAKPPTAG